MEDGEPPSKEDRDLIFIKLSKHIDIEHWQEEYQHLYTKWLNEDGTEIHDISADINKRMIEAVGKANEELVKNNMLLFYWFDVDRTENEDWLWKTDPIDQNPLFSLNNEYHYLNRNISLKWWIVFPGKK